MNYLRTILNNGKKTFTIMLSVSVLSFGLYSFAIVSTTLSISDSRVLVSNIQELNTEIAELEAQYYTIINDFSEEEAIAEGFDVNEHTYFAQANPEVLVALRN